MFCYSFKNSLSGHCCFKRSLFEKQSKKKKKKKKKKKRKPDAALKVIFTRFEKILE